MQDKHKRPATGRADYGYGEVCAAGVDGGSVIPRASLPKEFGAGRRELAELRSLVIPYAASNNTSSNVWTRSVMSDF